MEGSLTFYDEYHFPYLTGIEHVESKNIQGALLMKRQFHPGADMSAAMAETVAYVNHARAYGVSPDEIVQAIAQANVLSPSGNLNLGGQYPIVPANAMVRNIRDLEAVRVRVQASGTVFVLDLATVDDASDLVTSYALVNARRTVYLAVTKRADDIRVSCEGDQSPVVTRLIGDLVKEGAVGTLLTGLMGLLFFGRLA